MIRKVYSYNNITYLFVNHHIINILKRLKHLIVNCNIIDLFLFIMIFLNMLNHHFFIIYIYLQLYYTFLDQFYKYIYNFNIIQHSIQHL